MILVFACSIFPSDGAIPAAAFAFFFFALAIHATAWGLFASALCFPVSALGPLVPACFRAGIRGFQAAFGRVQATSCRLQAMIRQIQAISYWSQAIIRQIQATIRRVQAVIGRRQAVSMRTSSGARQERIIHGQARFSF